MPRKRTISDEELLDAALGLVRERGPDALSFGTLAPRVGLAGSTIVQRFGTKAGLLRATLLLAWDRLDEDTATAARTAALGRDGVIDLLVRLSGQYDPTTFADQLLLLREDLRDPVLRARGEAWLSTLSEEIERRLGAVSGGRVGLGELVVAQWQGALTVWSFTRRAPLKTFVRGALEDLLTRLNREPGPATP
jgi:AcrR family transcriptional regulator